MEELLKNHKVAKLTQAKQLNSHLLIKQISLLIKTYLTDDHCCLHFTWTHQYKNSTGNRFQDTWYQLEETDYWEIQKNWKKPYYYPSL